MVRGAYRGSFRLWLERHDPLQDLQDLQDLTFMTARVTAHEGTETRSPFRLLANLRFAARTAAASAGGWSGTIHYRICRICRI
jgi:hypothetical protein